MSLGHVLRWVPPGPVALAFVQSVGRVIAIMGPIGGGKTSSVFIKAIMFAQRQRQSILDGIRKFKLCCVRDTYRQLWKTTIPSWHEWVPKNIGEWSGGDNGPASHTVRFRIADGSIVELIVDFVAIGDNKVEDVLRGYQPTVFYLNEGDLLAPDVFRYARGREGRYPGMKEGGPTYWGTWLDFNAPDDDNWIYGVFLEDRPEGFEFFRQPSGFSSRAENLQNLPPNYYQEAARGQPEWWIRRMIRNEFGYSRDGKPVFPEYSDLIHCAPEPLVALDGLPLKIGLDAGATPAATIWQRKPNGQWRGLHELFVPNTESMGPKRFGKWLNQELQEQFPGIPVKGWADPSADFGGDQEEQEDWNWLDKVRQETGINIRPAPSNIIHDRLDAVRGRLTEMIDGYEPGLLISPTMRVVRKGFNSGYRYRRLKVAEGRYEDKPEKNDYSHPHDSIQYVFLGGGEYEAVRGRSKTRDQRRRLLVKTDDDPRGHYQGGPEDERPSLRVIT